MFEVDLKTQVTPSGPDNPDWGGPACCQMAMGGYPPGATSCSLDQTTIWNYIQANNKEGGLGPWGIGWYSDPFAITKTLNDLCPPQHHWIDISGTDKNGVLYTLFRWMANYRYASLVCVYEHDYWSTLVYYRTSDDPRTTTNPTLEYIGWYEPAFQSGGPAVQYKEVTGSVWLSSPYYWGLPCGGTAALCGQLWNGKYVGIGEPPEVEGSVKVKVTPRTGTRLITPQDAAAVARAVVAERQKRESKSVLDRVTGVRGGRPMLVRELPVTTPGKKKSKEDVRYYLVPFAGRYEIDKTGAPLARLSVLVNAYTGEFEELCAFSRPVRYLSEDEARAIAGRALGLGRRDLSRMELELVYRPLRAHVSTAQPAWYASIDERAVHVSQLGEIFGTLQYPTYRGA